MKYVDHFPIKDIISSNFVCIYIYICVCVSRSNYNTAVLFILQFLFSLDEINVIYLCNIYFEVINDIRVIDNKNNELYFL